MIQNRKSPHDNTSSEDTTRRPDPRHVTFANSCGIAAAMLFAILAFYYALIGTGHLPPPALGVVPIWTMAITMLGAVKLAQWAADRAANHVVQIMDQRYATLLGQTERVSDEALQRAEEGGQWKGIATAYREDPSASVVPFGRRGNNAN